MMRTAAASLMAPSIDQPRKRSRGGQRRATVGILLLTDAIALYQKGHTLQYIGDQAGVTRERIRQILTRAGVSFRSPAIQRLRDARRQQRIEAKAVRRAAQRAEKREVYEKKIAQWSELWRSGRSLKQMGALLGLTKEAVGVKINYFRQQESEALFPRRNLPLSALPMSRRLRQMWSSGKKIVEIAAKTGISYHQVRYWLERSRQKHGIEAFPYHNRVDDQYSQISGESNAHYSERLKKVLQPLKRGWAAGESIQNLARSMNIPIKRIYQLIASARVRFGWFPKRDSEKRATHLRTQLRTQLRRELAEANRLWRSGMSVPHIAETVGLPLQQLRHNINQARRVIGNSWFARRTPSKDDRQKNLRRMSALWKKGWSTQAIAKIMGLKTESMNCKIHLQRRKGRDDLFPRRHQVHAHKAPA